MQNPNRRRFFAIRASVAKKAANDNVTFCGRTIAVTEENAGLIEIIREADAQAAYEAACNGFDAQPRIAA